MTPLIKWVGGKTCLLPEIVARMPKKFGTYFEPFAGGAALFFHLEPESAVLGDMNEHVINTYRSVLRCCFVVDAELEHHAESHTKRHYYATRAVWNRTFWSERQDTGVDSVGNRWAHRAAMFLYMNRTCFNGLWRENKRGKMNVPMGRYKNPTIYNPVLLRTAQLVLGHATFRVGPFWQTVQTAARGDFVYFDPPYDPISATSSFTAYGRAGFGRHDQAMLCYTAAELAARGVKVMISNSNTRFIRELYRDFDVRKVYRRGTMNSDAQKRGRVAELLITSY